MRILTGVIAALGLAIAAPALAHEFRVGALEIIHPAIPAPPASAKSAGAYFAVVNAGDTPDRLIAVEGSMARAIQIHTSETSAAGVTSMRQLQDGVVIPPGATVRLQRGGMHVMLMGLIAPLQEGDKLPATLVFEKAGAVDVVFNVEARGEGAPEHNAH